MLKKDVQSLWRSEPAFKILQELSEYSGEGSTSYFLQTQLNKKQSTISELLSLLEEHDCITKNIVKKKKYFYYSINKLGILKNYFTFVNQNKLNRMNDDFINYEWFKKDFFTFFDEAIQNEKYFDLWDIFLSFTNAYLVYLYDVPAKRKISKIELDKVRHAFAPYSVNNFPSSD